MLATNAQAQPQVLTVKTKNGNTFVGVNNQLRIMDQNNKLLASTTNLTISSPIIGIGLSTKGNMALVSIQSSIQLFLVVLQQNNTIDVIKLAKPIGNFISFGRIENAFVANNSEIFMMVANSKTTGSIIAYEVGDVVDVKSILSLPTSAVNDIRPASADFKTWLVAAKIGLLHVSWDGNKLSTKGSVIKTAPGNDGLDVIDGFYVPVFPFIYAKAYVAAQGSGLRIINLRFNTVVGTHYINGWAGGVRAVHSKTNIDIAYVAADPGLLAFDVSIDRSPELIWTCKLPNGLGWNLDITSNSRTNTNTIYLADNKGGMYTLNHDMKKYKALPNVVNHVGPGAMQQCQKSSKEIEEINEIKESEGDSSKVDDTKNDTVDTRLQPIFHTPGGASDGYAGDPNGLMYYKGIYHFFWQRIAPKWPGPVVWGHITSTNFAKWTHQPDTLGPGAFSGGATILPNGNIKMLYKDVSKGNKFYTASPSNITDPFLKIWNEASTPTAMVGSTDPSSGWKSSKGGFYAVVGALPNASTKSNPLGGASLWYVEMFSN